MSAKAKLKSLWALAAPNWPLYLFILLNFIGIFFHECWREELQTFLIAKAAHSPWDLIARTARYEGQPLLWPLLVKLFTIGSFNPIVIQLLNSFFICGTAILFWFHFPLDKKIKSLLLFNYFFIFEYGLIARPFALSAFLLFAYLSYSESPVKRLRYFAILGLLLLPQTSFFGLIIASCLMIIRILSSFKKSLFQTTVEGVLFALSSFVSVVHGLLLPEDAMSSMLSNYNFVSEEVLRVLESYSFSMFHLPGVISFPPEWSVFLGDSSLIGYIWLGLFLSGLIWFTHSLIQKNKLIAFAFVVSSFALFKFSYVRALYGIQFTAHILLLMAAVFWLSQKIKETFLVGISRSFVLGVAALSAFSGISFYLTDIALPFSDAKTVSKVLVDATASKNELIIAWPDFVGSSVSGYSKGRETFSVEAMRPNTYIQWDKARMSAPPTLGQFEVWVRDQGLKELVFITNNTELNTFLGQRFLIESLYKSSFCMVQEECYEVLRVVIQGSRRGSEPKPGGRMRGPRLLAEQNNLEDMMPFPTSNKRNLETHQKTEAIQIEETKPNNSR